MILTRDQITAEEYLRADADHPVESLVLESSLLQLSQTPADEVEAAAVQSGLIRSPLQVVETSVRLAQDRRLAQSQRCWVNTMALTGC